MSCSLKSYRFHNDTGKSRQTPVSLRNISVQGEMRINSDLYDTLSQAVNYYTLDEEVGEKKTKNKRQC